MAIFNKSQASAYLSAQYSVFSNISTHLTKGGIYTAILFIPINPYIAFSFGVKTGMEALSIGKAQDEFKFAGDKFYNSRLKELYLIKTTFITIQTVGGESSISNSETYKFYQPGGKLVMQIDVKN